MLLVEMWSIQTRPHKQRGEAVLSHRRNLLVCKWATEPPYSAAGYWPATIGD